MDAGLQIKELSSLTGVTRDKVVNWEIRGIPPSKSNLDRTKAIYVQFELAVLKKMTKNYRLFG